MVELGGTPVGGNEKACLQLALSHSILGQKPLNWKGECFGTRGINLYVDAHRRLFMRRDADPGIDVGSVFDDVIQVGLRMILSEWYSFDHDT